MSLPAFTGSASGRYSRRGALRTLCAALAAPLLMFGCAAPQNLPAPTAAWETHMGQLQYRGATGKSVIGEVVVRRLGASDFALDFMSGPGFPLLKLQESGDRAVAEGVFARGRWSGSPQSAPKQLKSWTSLREVFAKLSPSNPRFQQGAWSAEAHFSGQRVEHLEVIVAATGERFAFHFSR